MIEKLRSGHTMVNCLIVDDDRKILDYVATHLINEHIRTHTF